MLMDGCKLMDDVDDRTRHAGAGIDRARVHRHRLEAALVQEHDDRATPWSRRSWRGS
jgi:hypothetical protein